LFFDRNDHVEIEHAYADALANIHFVRVRE